MPIEEQTRLREILNSDVDGVEGFGDTVFEQEKEDFERM